jgi:hypothetical protein
MTVVPKTIAILALIGAVAACAGPKGSGERSDTTSEPRPVEQASDIVNIAAETEAQPALVVTVAINENDVLLQRARILRAPPARRTGENDQDQVLFRAYKGEKVVGTATVSDPVVNVQEGVGLVELTQRTVTAAVPIEEPADFLEVISSQGRFATVRFSVLGVVTKHCRAYPKSRLCKGGID